MNQSINPSENNFRIVCRIGNPLDIEDDSAEIVIYGHNQDGLEKRDYAAILAEQLGDSGFFQIQIQERTDTGWINSESGEDN